MACYLVLQVALQVALQRVLKAGLLVVRTVVQS